MSNDENVLNEFCVNGHDLSVEGFYTVKRDGSKRCRRCQYEANARCDAKRLAKKKAQGIPNRVVYLAEKCASGHPLEPGHPNVRVCGGRRYCKACEVYYWRKRKEDAVKYALMGWSTSGSSAKDAERSRINSALNAMQMPKPNRKPRRVLPPT